MRNSEDINSYIDRFLDLQSDPPDFRGIDGLQVPRNMSQKQENISRKRIGRLSNNSFKAPLRLFIKVILKLGGPESLRSQIRLISREKNLQTFPKLVCFCQKQGVRGQISEIWSSQVQKYLQQNRQVCSTQKFNELQKWASRMTLSLQSTDWTEFIKIYWGDKVRHKDKLQDCIRQIENINTFQY